MVVAGADRFGNFGIPHDDVCIRALNQRALFGIDIEDFRDVGAGSSDSASFVTAVDSTYTTDCASACLFAADVLEMRQSCLNDTLDKSYCKFNKPAALVASPDLARKDLRSPYLVQSPGSIYLLHYM